VRAGMCVCAGVCVRACVCMCMCVRILACMLVQSKDECAHEQEDICMHKHIQSVYVHVSVI